MLVVRLVTLLSLACCTTAALASIYPERPIRYIVPSAAGGGADISARLLTNHLSGELKQQFVVDNRPSAAGLIGMELLVRARPDGYTLGYGNMTYLAINPSLIPKLPYDVGRDVALVGQFTQGQNILAVRPSLPVKSVAELLAYLRANPGKLTFASSGNGTTLHLSGELFKQLTGTQMVHVPYKAVQQAITELIGGQVDVIFDNQPSIGPHVLGGRVRALAVTGPVHSIAFPALPTIAEAGVPGYAITTWTAMIAPRGIPGEIVARLNAGIARACASLRQKLEATGQECATKTPQEFAAFVKSEQSKWGDIVRKSGARLD